MSVFENLNNTDIPARLDRLAVKSLGYYVYVLVDPRDNKIFYVGKGKASRVLQHLKKDTARDDSIGVLLSKQKLIDEIRKEGFEPNWQVVARQLPTEETAFIVEGSIIYALLNCENSVKLVNQNRGMHLKEFGGLTADQVVRLQARPISPATPHPCVFLFNISIEFKKSRDVYASTRRAWKDINSELRRRPIAIAVGLEEGISRGVYQIDHGSWQEVEKRRWEFSGSEIASSEFNERDWKAVTTLAKGRWLRGGYLAVEFNGEGSVRFLIGHKSKDKWHRLRTEQQTTVAFSTT